MNSKPPTVLHVEDDENDRLFVSLSANKLGIPLRLHSVNDGEEALEYLQGSNAFSNRELYPIPDLILLDLKLPRRSGFQVLEWIRAQEGLKDVPVLILTSSEHHSDMQKAELLGANGYHVKPVSGAALPNLLSGIFAKWLKTSAPSQADPLGTSSR